MAETPLDASEAIPDVVEPLVAYRSWHVANFVLLAFNGHPWMIGEPTKALCSSSLTRTGPCRKSPCPAGTKDHSGEGCGIYGYKSPCVVPLDGVVGKVRLWGTVYEYTEGYRAEFAEPICLYLTEDNKDEWDTIKRVAQVYGIEAVEWDFSDEDLAKNHLSSLLSKIPSKAEGDEMMSEETWATGGFIPPGSYSTPGNSVVPSLSASPSVQLNPTTYGDENYMSREPKKPFDWEKFWIRMGLGVLCVLGIVFATALLWIFIDLMLLWPLSFAVLGAGIPTAYGLGKLVEKYADF